LTIEPGNYEDTFIYVNSNGICQPEYLREKEDHVNFIMENLKDRNIIYDVRIV
jgi:hypothetical protein